MLLFSLALPITVDVAFAVSDRTAIKALVINKFGRKDYFEGRVPEGRRGWSIDYIRVADNWALVGTDVQPVGGGEHVWHKEHGGWKFVRGWGGAMTASDLHQYCGVPMQTARKLTSLK